MALPNPGMDAVPFTPLTAEFLDDMIENIQSLSSGTGFATGAIGAGTLANGAVAKSNIDYTSVDVYSTSETDTCKKWVDGRTIYRKVLVGNITIAVGANDINHGISGITSLEPVNIVFSIVLSSTTRGVSRNLSWHRETSGNWANPTQINNTTLTITSSFAWGASAYTAILEYVK